MATSIDQSEFIKTALRLPPALHAAVHASAKETGRSYNAELIALIEAGLNPKQDDSLSKALAVSVAKAEEEAARRTLEAEVNLIKGAQVAVWLMDLLSEVDLLGVELPHTTEELDGAFAQAYELQYRADHAVDSGQIDRAFEEARAAEKKLAAAKEAMSGRPADKRKYLLVGNIGSSRPSSREKVIIQQTPLAPKPANKGPLRSPNARKPKP